MIARARKLVRDLWAGDVPLAKAFWEYAVLYAILLNALTTMGSFALWSQGWMASGLIVHLLPVPYAALCYVAVWRAAGKYPGDRKWAGMARVAVAVLCALAVIL